MLAGRGNIPPRSTCEELAEKVSPAGAVSPNAVAAAIKGIPSVPLQVAATSDLQAKVELIISCAQGKATQRAATQASSTSSLVAEELRQLGIHS